MLPQVGRKGGLKPIRLLLKVPLTAGALVVLIFVSTSAPATATPCGRQDRCSNVLHVSRDFRTIQGAIDAAADGDTILIDAGVYNETLRVEGKRLRIIGSDEGRTEVASSSRTTGLITYTNGGGGELKDVLFSGGAYAIGGARGDESLPSELAVKNVSSAGGFRGIYGRFSSLTLKAVAVSGTEWHGISITYVSNVLALFDVVVQGAGGVGLLILNYGPGDISIGGHFHHNSYGGIEVEGNNGTVHLLFAATDHNYLYGLGLFTANVGIALSSFTDEGHPTSGGCTGAGMMAVASSEATISGSYFADDCFALTNAGSSVTITSNTFNSTTGVPAFLSGDTSPLFNDGGGNVCGFDIGTPQESIVGCQTWLLGGPIDPDDLPPPVLE
jgi:hypothetical protein